MSKSAGGHAEPFFLFTYAKVQQKKLGDVQYCAILCNSQLFSKFHP